MEAEEYLKDWAEKYLRNKDLLQRKLVLITLGKNSLHAKFKDKEADYIVAVKLGDIDKIIEKNEAGKELGIITINSKANKDVLIKKWDFLSKYENLIMIFINPFSNGDDKWLIRPAVHSRICSRSGLAKGIASISENVDIITEDEYSERIK